MEIGNGIQDLVSLSVASVALRCQCYVSSELPPSVFGWDVMRLRFSASRFPRAIPSVAIVAPSIPALHL